MSTQPREYGHSPAFTRYAVKLLGHNPDAYYMIGVEHRIPEPTPEAMAKCVGSLLEAGFSPEAIETAMAVLGVPGAGAIRRSGSGEKRRQPLAASNC